MRQKQLLKVGIKMKKQNIALFSATLATMVGFGLSNSAEVQADSNDTVTQTPVATSESPQKMVDAAQSEVNDAQKVADTTQAEANAAKETAENSQAAANAAQNEANSAKEAVDTAQETVSEAEKAAEAATPEKIEEAQNSVLEQEKANEALKESIEEDKKAVDAAESEVDTAQNNVDSAKEAVDAAQTDLDKSQETVDEKQKAVDEAQSIIDGEGAAEANENLEKAQEELDTAKEAEEAAKTEAETAASAEEDAQTAKDTAETATNEASIAVEAAAQKKQEADEAVEKAQSDLDKAKSEVNTNLNKIVVTQEYVDALKAYLNDRSEANKKRLLAAEADALAANAAFQSNADDEAVIINSQADMTPDILEELSLFAASLINSIRQEFGKIDVTVSLGAIKFADEIAKAYEADDWSPFGGKGHNNAAINEAAKNNGLLEHPGGNLYENLYSYSSSSMDSSNAWGYSKDYLKRNIYNAILGFLYEDGDSNWGHANSITGLMYGDSTDECYFGVSFSKASSPSFSTHFVSVPRSFYIKEPSKFDTEAIDIPDINEGDIQAKIEQLTQELVDKEKAAETAAEELENAQTVADDANQKFEEAKAELEEAKANNQEAQAKLTAATTAVETATAKVEAAQEIVDNFKADEQTKLEALEVAKEALEEAKKDEASKQTILEEAQKQLDTVNERLTEMQEALTTAQEKLAADEQALEEGVTALAQKQAEVENLKNASNALSEAQSALDKAKADYEAALKQAESAKNTADKDAEIYESLQAKADEAKEKLKAAKEKLANLQKYLDLSEELNPVEEKLEENVNVQSNAVVISLADKSKGSSNDQTEVINLKPSRKEVAKTDLVKLTAKTTKSSSVLPKTGFSDTPKLSILGAILLSFLGLLGVTNVDEKNAASLNKSKVSQK